MYARVAKFEGGEADSIRANTEEIKGRAASGPPEGVPAVGFTFLIDPENGRTIGVSLFETEEDMRAGDQTLNAMSPPVDVGTRSAVEFYEVAIDIRQ
jgi:hypothetical protein